MIAVGQIDGDTTADDLAALRRALGIVGFTLVQRESGIFIAKSTSYPLHARYNKEDIIAVGASTYAPEAVRRSIEKYAERAHARGRRAS